MAASLESRALLDDGAGADHAVIVDDAGVEGAVGLDCHVLTNVHRRSYGVRQRVISADSAAVTDRGEVADTDGVHVSADHHSVPHSGVL